MDGKELCLRVEAIANEKRISQDDVFYALEDALSLVSEKHSKHKIRISINRISGEFETFRRWLVVEDGTIIIDEIIDFNDEIHIEQKDANGLEINDFVEQKVETIQLGRVEAQIVKQVIIQKVKEAERARIVAEYKDRIGETIQATIRKIERGNIYLDLGGIDGIIPRAETIPNELLHKDDRIKAYIVKVNQTLSGVQIILSRANKELLSSLFAMEVPEIADGVIEVKSVARDPGLRAKVAVYTRDKRIDPIGTCIGMRGSRVQAVSDGINGERIDVILWDEDIVQFVINAMKPADIVSIDIDEDNRVTEVAVEDEQLSQAIGSKGQNIRLASEVTDYKINVISTSQLLEKQQDEENKLEQDLAKMLDIDIEVANTLVTQGFTSLEHIINADDSDLLAIDSLDNESVSILKAKAEDESLARALSDNDSIDVLLSVDGVDEDLASVLIAEGINSQDDLADLSADELIDIYNMDKEIASSIIMSAREPWFK